MQDEEHDVELVETEFATVRGSADLTATASSCTAEEATPDEIQGALAMASAAADTAALTVRPRVRGGGCVPTLTTESRLTSLRTFVGGGSAEASFASTCCGGIRSPG